MTMLADHDIRRHPDGSIDIRFHALRASALRRAAIEDHGRRQLRAWRAAFAAVSRLACLALSRTVRLVGPQEPPSSATFAPRGR